MKNTEIEIVLEFVEGINSADIGKIVNLMSDEHIFIDSGDCKYQGKDFMKQGWINYFTMFPDYKIEIIDIIGGIPIVGIFGYASGTFIGMKNKNNSNYFRIPASWKAIVQEGKVVYWQVFCESKQIEQIVESNK